MKTAGAKNDKKEHTSGSVLRENQWYPRHESDRADALVDELDEGQIKRLYGELKTRTLAEWLCWLEDARGSICQYDALSAAGRKSRLKKLPESHALMLQHACVFLELWRWRVHCEYFHLPPNAGPIDTHERQRNLMLNVVAAYHRHDKRDLWPFDHPDIEDKWPFREEDA